MAKSTDTPLFRRLTDFMLKVGLLPISCARKALEAKIEGSFSESCAKIPPREKNTAVVYSFHRNIATAVLFEPLLEDRWGLRAHQ